VYRKPVLFQDQLVEILEHGPGRDLAESMPVGLADPA
jgi:hypothetical protein